MGDAPQSLGLRPALNSVKMPRWVNLANLFTLIRLILVPFIIQAIVSGHHGLALELFAGAALTDVLDGAAARHLRLNTAAGAYLDPIADKALLSGVYLALAIGRIVPWWFVFLVFGRDIYILLAAATVLLTTPIRNFPPSIWGKACTFVQILTAVTWMARDVLETRMLDAFAAVILWPCAAITIWSGIHYTWRGIQVVKTIDGVGARE
jgi:cardiolipin synthase (CMP-forming)